MKQFTNSINRTELLKWCEELRNIDIEIICAIYELVNGVILEDVSSVYSKEDMTMFVVTNRQTSLKIVKSN